MKLSRARVKLTNDVVFTMLNTKSISEHFDFLANPPRLHSKKKRCCGKALHHRSAGPQHLPVDYTSIKKKICALPEDKMRLLKSLLSATELVIVFTQQKKRKNKENIVVR